MAQGPGGVPMLLPYLEGVFRIKILIFVGCSDIIVMKQYKSLGRYRLCHLSIAVCILSIAIGSSIKRNGQPRTPAPGTHLVNGGHCHSQPNPTLLLPLEC